MVKYLAINTQNFMRKYWILTELIVELLVPKTAISSFALYDVILRQTLS